MLATAGQVATVVQVDVAGVAVGVAVGPGEVVEGSGTIASGGIVVWELLAGVLMDNC